MLECAGCNCRGRNPKHPALVRQETAHELVTKSANCKLWFLYADLMVRNMANNYRSEANAAKLNRCTGLKTKKKSNAKDCYTFQ